MPIDTGIPSSIRRPGAFHAYRFSVAGAGLTTLALRLALVGMQSSAATATVEQPVQVFDAADADDKFGAGSELALMCRKAFEQISLGGGIGPEIWAIPIAEPGAGTAQTNTFTFTGPATESGNLEVRIAGRTIVIGVASGDSADAIAGYLEDELDAQAANLPVTAGVAANVVTITHVTKGENGGDVDVEVVKRPAGVGCVAAAGFAGAGVVDITNAINALFDRQYDAVAIANRKAADVADAVANLAIAWGYAQKMPRHIVIGDPTTLSAANALSAAANDKGVIVVSCEDSPSLPGEVAAAVAAYAWSKERPNANYDFGKLALYPPAAASAYTSAEIESALAAGTTPLVPTDEGDKLQIVKLVTTKTTTNSAPDYTLADLAISRTAAWMSLQIDARYQIEFPQEVLDTDPDSPDNVLDRIRDMVVGIHRAAEALRPPVIKDVDSMLPSITVTASESVIGRVDVIDPFKVVVPLHQAAFLHHAQVG